MRTVITHFFNEEYLLPWWLMHHRKFFDHGIMINYDSTDRSVDIIKEYCPTWDIVTSRNRQFGAVECDYEVMDYEASVKGWKTCLNVTEFMIGDFSLLDDKPNQLLVAPCYIMVDSDTSNNDKLTYDEPLIKQKPHGIFYDPAEPITIERCCRGIHNMPRYEYTTGRHFMQPNTYGLQVLWYGYSPLTRRMLDRKLQIQHRIPESDKSARLGHHHFTDEVEQDAKFQRYLPYATDLSVKLNLDV